MTQGQLGLWFTKLWIAIIYNRVRKKVPIDFCYVPTNNNHMPMKKRKTVHKPVPFMNQQLRKAIYKKQMLHNKYLHLRSNKNWETYHQQRNFVNKLRRQSIRNYFVEINVNKATAFDGVSVKIMKIAKPVIVKPITKLINKSISSAKFPDNLKEAHVVPLHKKNSQLEARNYRPVSILPVVSKFFERAIYQQLIDYFDSIFNPYLSAFRPGYGCNTALLKVIEDWKKAVNNNLYVAAVLMDLSKAFDCLPHDLLLLKLKVYSLSENALNLTDDYLSNRKQCVKVGTYFSTWQNIYKGVPQGSILGPVLFNVFLNDIFNFVKEYKLYNYADDNTLSHSGPDLDGLVKSLEKESAILIDWFANNKMKANPDKFEAIAIGNK